MLGIKVLLRLTWSENGDLKVYCVQQRGAATLGSSQAVILSVPVLLKSDTMTDCGFESRISQECPKLFVESKIGIQNSDMVQEQKRTWHAPCLDLQCRVA